LRGHAGVGEAVVVVREDAPGDRRLVAYVVPAEGGEALPRWRDWLAARLPDYMIPTLFVELAALPLSPAVKLDRRALPVPERGSDLSSAPPATPAEELLAEIWSEVLGVDRVGSGDDFFALGGHSLLATQVVSRVRTVFGVELPVRAVFESPALAEQAIRIEHLRAGEPAVPELPLVGVPREGDLPLSFAQQRMWFLDRLTPGSPLYNIPSPLRVAGPLDSGLLAQVLSELSWRHESLRTTFDAVGGEPRQRIHPPSPLWIPVVDLEPLPRPVRLGEAERLALEEAGEGFDLERGPLLRVRLVRLDTEDHVLLATLHHIVSDGWSTGVMIREVSALYEAFQQGLPSPLAELPVQYADFSHWQRLRLSGESLEAELGYWRGRLSGLPAVLELPTDRPRPAVQRFRGAAQPVGLGPELSLELASLCRRERVTRFMALLAAFQVLLGRVTSQESFGVGTPIAGRTRVELEGLIGFFVNTLVLRAQLEGEPGFGELLGRVREEALDAHAHQELPFERLVEELQIERSLSQTPLFQAMLPRQKFPEASLELPGLRLVALNVESGTAKFDLNLSLSGNAGSLGGSLGYNSDLFDGSTMLRLVGQLHTLLTAGMVDPEQRIWELPLLSPSESHQLRVEWNDTASALSLGEACVHALIEAQVSRTPDAVAVSFESQSLTYGELNLRANRLAWRLRGLGVGPEVRVGVCLERSLDLPVALLGVLKAGGAYVPLDPEYPQERLVFMLKDSGVAALVTQETLDVVLPAGDIPRVLLEEERRAGEEKNPASGATADQLMYVIYTSGSTGRPKGVMVPHRGVVNRLLWSQWSYPLTSEDRVLHNAAFSFDFSVWEIFAPLLVGGRLIVARPGGQRDSAYLVRTIQEQAVTHVHFVPSMLQAFLSEPGVGDCIS